MKFFLVSLCMFMVIFMYAQESTSLRGTLTDAGSGLPIVAASVSVVGWKQSPGCISDSTGSFVIRYLPPGRYTLQVSCVGYETTLIPELLITAGRQTVLELTIREQVKSLEEVTVSPQVKKDRPLNNMAVASARMFSVDEAKRYAGGFDDPSRLAGSFAGVASNSEENGIMVRGNAPKFLQWKMEDVEIPNPNHFGDLKTFGGGTLTALSSQMLSNSDFFTGAFPAEYSNALSGVFDLNLRTGNNEQQENTFQAGIIGIDAASEGPFRKNGKSSYLFNYRYSTLALLSPLLPENANTLKYQDLSFKLNFPTRKAGIFSIWGFGLVDAANSNPKKNQADWKYAEDNEDSRIKASTMAAGISHKYFFRRGASVKTTLAITGGVTEWNTDKQDEQLNFHPKNRIYNNNFNFVFSSAYNKKLSQAHTNRTGLVITAMQYDVRMQQAPSPGLAMVDIVNSKGNSALVSAYSSSLFRLSDRYKLSTGINASWFALNNHYSIEPRLGITRALSSNHSIAFAFGLHSRLERLGYYFANALSTGEKAVNKQLDFTRASHCVLSYDWKLSELLHFKTEAYLQDLYRVPVVADSSFSLLNLKSDWFFAEKLVNTGKGRNIGIDLTLEKSISKGYYYLLTGSLFKSRYTGGDGIWRDTRYNRNYVVNFLIGKEWQLGRRHQNTFSLNTRWSLQGGSRYSPLELTRSLAAQAPVYEETKAFSLQEKPMFNLHFTGSYRINRKLLSHEIALKIINLTRQPDFNGFRYNMITHSMDRDVSAILIPNLSYKIEF